MSSPSVSYSITVRLEMPAQPSAVSTITTTVERAGGIVTAVDVSGSGLDRLQVDVTCATGGEDDAKHIVDALGDIDGVTIGRVSDRTFLAHLGGKIEIQPKMQIRHRDDLSLIYTPGVGRVSQQLAAHPEDAVRLTIKRNTVAVVTDGSAVLGLGNIGPTAALPVMEGKAALFKRFAGIDAFPICLDTQDVDEIVRTVQIIAPVFAGINLEDISAPRCFEIEERLRAELDIPVFHDDQHGTAIVALAALRNALKVVGKNIEDVRIVQSGAGAAGSAILRLMLAAGARHVVVADVDGVIRADRADLEPSLQWIADATEGDQHPGTLHDVIVGADVFIGVSAPNLLAEADVAAMAERSIVFAMANPLPEIDPAIATRHAAVVATGRSDFANQINNVLAFPGVFRGLLDGRSTRITDEMLLAAATALADVVGPEELNATYIVPSVFHQNLHTAIAASVQAAAEADSQSRSSVTGA
ncbi:NAD-dependent malic enzyme [Ruania halotolerans]|uniref:NAD-dependent malic enzyme n=1 Tax=Ruania halotolerans TaxID=2897773 RepID=UPI001E2D010C|nr:NAD-dependent malic enzyme [Ruania halotolerans]UFU05998.1 NAD-dependent malic enzyme [Ruania halotolerans]